MPGIEIRQVLDRTIVTSLPYDGNGDITDSHSLEMISCTGETGSDLPLGGRVQIQNQVIVELGLPVATQTTDRIQ